MKNSLQKEFSDQLKNKLMYEKKTASEAVIRPFLLVTVPCKIPMDDGKFATEKRIQIWLRYDEDAILSNDTMVQRSCQNLIEYESAAFLWRVIDGVRTKIFLCDFYKNNPTDVLVSAPFAQGTMSAWMPAN